MNKRQKSTGNKTRIACAALIIVLLLASNGCMKNNLEEKRSHDIQKALSTINIINDLVKNVAGDKINTISLLPVGSDPHVYEPVPWDVQQIVDSDIVFYNGLNLEKWLEELLENAGGERQAYPLTKGLTPRRDAKGDPDPHLWIDPVSAMKYVENIRDVLVEFDPEHAEEYRHNADTYLAELEELDTWIKNRIGEIPPHNRKLVTTHDAYAYFGERYGFKVVGSIWGITTEDEPSAQEVAVLVDRIKAEKVPAVFIETTINPKLMERIAKDAGVRVGKPLYGDSLGVEGSGAEAYIGMMRTNVNNIVEGLR